MPIVKNWTEPLERAIKAKLSSTFKKDYATLRQAQQMAALLDGATQSDDLAKSLEKYAGELESEYQTIVEAVRQGNSPGKVEENVKRLEAFRGYKEAEAIIAEGRERAARLRQEEADRAKASKKRKTRVFLAVAAVAVAALAFFIVRGTLTYRRIEGRIAEARAMVDAGKRTDAVDVVSTLAGEGVTGQEHPSLYEVTEAMLEGTAADEGYDAAFELFDRLLEDMPDTVDKDGFRTFASARVTDTSLETAQRWTLFNHMMRRDMNVSGFDKDDATALVLDYASTLSPVEAWPVIRNARAGNVGHITDVQLSEAFMAYAPHVPADGAFDAIMDDVLRATLPASAVAEVGGACLDLLSDELSTADHRDMQEWVSAHWDILEGCNIGPDHALRFLYALHGAGYDVVSLFPDGMKVDIPLASNMQHLIDKLRGNASEGAIPDMRGVLPLSIVEDDHYDNRSIYNIKDTLSTMLDSKITKMQADDAHYTVRLLTRYLFDIPEELRPATFADCTSVLCMQQTYLPGGHIYQTITTESRYSRGGSSLPDLGSSLPGLGSTTYRVFFSALDMTTVYDLSDPDASEAISVNVHEAKVSDEAYFEANKDNDYALYTADNMLGVFDNAKLRADYETTINNVEELNLYILLNRIGNEGENTNDAD